MTHLTKTIQVKADGGSIEGYFSTWTREPDAYGDVVAKGAFTETFERIRENGGTVPFLWNHEAGDLGAYIGTAYDFAEDDHGAFFRATFDDTEQAQRARELAKDGRLAKFSFAYDVLDQGEVTLEDGRKANELRKLELYEVSLVMYPANPDTGVVDVKADEKAGRRNSAKDTEQLERIRSLASEIQTLIDELTTDGDGEGEGAEDADPKAGPDVVEAYRQAVKTLIGD